MDELEELYNDTIYLIKKDGTRLGPGRALVSKSKIATYNTALDIEDGDTIARKVGNREEFYTVIDCGYSEGLGEEIPPSFNASVRKSTAPAPAPRSVTTNFHTQIHGGTGIQVGQHNTMEVNAAVQNLNKIIEDQPENHLPLYRLDGISRKTLRCFCPSNPPIPWPKPCPLWRAGPARAKRSSTQPRRSSSRTARRT